ncbi:MOP flippase family protein [Baekduia sp.]|jgi:O-antigen/teichoic acid export membrane protein|uniref:MOP flippase family protein n=1 Tax=Baekduia sp. TaxID=2600305 RepID=UPI002E02FF69|nr:MOP flippase family protein [Baekduia sp.]
MSAETLIAPAAGPEPAPTPDPPVSSLALRAQVLSGVMWKIVSQAFRQGSRLIVALILARLLTPEQFGVSAEVLVVSSLVIVFADLAFGAALIQRKEISELDKSTAFWACTLFGVFFTALGFVCAGPLADFYNEPQVEPLFRVMSFIFLTTSLSTVQESLLNRELSFKVLETRMMIATVGGAAVGITSAALGGGSWAIILQALSLSIFSTLLLWTMSPWRPRFQFSFASLKSMAGFSTYIFGHRLLYYLHRNSDNLLIGRFVGAASLGAYAIAYNVILVPFSRIAAPIQDVVFPAFSRIQNDKERIGEGWIRITRMVAAVTVPSLVGLAIVAGDFVNLVLGSKWHEATTVIQVLAWVGILQSLQSLNTGILEALGHARAIFRWTVVFFVAHLTAFVVGLHWGIVGVAVGYSISTTLIEPSYLLLTSRAVGMSPWRFLEAVAGVFEASAGMGLVVLGAHYGLVQADVPGPLRLLACVLIGAVVFAALAAWRQPEILEEVKDLRARRKGRSDLAPASLPVPAEA